MSSIKIDLDTFGQKQYYNQSIFGKYDDRMYTEHGSMGLWQTGWAWPARYRPGGLRPCSVQFICLYIDVSITIFIQVGLVVYVALSRQSQSNLIV